MRLTHYREPNLHATGKSLVSVYTVYQKRSFFTVLQFLQMLTNCCNIRIYYGEIICNSSIIDLRASPAYCYNTTLKKIQQDCAWHDVRIRRSSYSNVNFPDMIISDTYVNTSAYFAKISSQVNTHFHDSPFHWQMSDETAKPAPAVHC